MSESEWVLIGFIAGALLVILIVILANPSGIVEKQQIGTFICYSHELGSYKEMKILDNEVLYVSCEKEPLKNTQVKIRAGGVEQ